MPCTLRGPPVLSRRACLLQDMIELFQLPFHFLPPLARYRFGQPGNAGVQRIQLALDAHQQVRGYGYGKTNIAHRLQDRFQLYHPFCLEETHLLPKERPPENMIFPVDAAGGTPPAASILTPV